MTQAVEFRSPVDLEGQHNIQSTSFCGTSIQKVKDCWAQIRKPFSILSPSQVRDHYIGGSIGVIMGCFMTGVCLYEIIDTATNPNPKSPTSEGELIAFSSAIACLSLVLGTGGAIIIDKTRRAPRYQPLLLNPS